jgi:hypothetical protein
MELREAMEQIHEIRFRLAQTETFRGYRSATVALSGSIAFVAAGAQAIWLPDAKQDVASYLVLWIGAAVLAAAIAGGEMVVRCRRASDRLTASLTRLAVEQFLPCLIAGGLLTAVLTLFAPECLWMLPGLWQILFSLGMFASCRLLPRQTAWAAAFYLVSGITCLVVARGPAELAPWAMGLPFGIGQFLTAGILYGTLERDHGQFPT